MAAPKARIFGFGFSVLGIVVVNGRGRKKSGRSGFIRFFFFSCLLIYGRQEKPNPATLIFRTARVTTMRQVRSRILAAVKSFFRDRERVKTPQKWERPEAGLGTGFCQCPS